MPIPRPGRPGAAIPVRDPAAPADPYARLTAIILAGAETAGLWTPPWHNGGALPRNVLTGRPYNGINVLALWAAAQMAAYTDARWGTYRQWAALGAQVRRGQRGTAILFYRDLRIGHGDGRDDAAEGAGTGCRFVARSSTVFNAAQVEGAPDLTTAAAPPSPKPIAVIDAFAAAAGAHVVVGGARACYVPATDIVRVPPPESFRTGEAYAGTLAHELVHWSGAPHRLARDLTGRFGTHAYAAEELVAELGGAFVLADLGPVRVPHADHAAYVRGWLPLLRAEPRALAHAASQAARAAAYLAGLQPGADAGGGASGVSLGIEAGTDESDPAQAAA